MFSYSLLKLNKILLIYMYIFINTYVPNDCESLPINIDEIAIGRRESEREKMGERDGDRKQGNDKSDREKGRKADTENDKERETEQKEKREGTA